MRARARLSVLVQGIAVGGDIARRCAKTRRRKHRAGAGKTSYRRRRRRGSRGGSERRRRHRRARARRRANAAGHRGSRHRSHASRRASECRDSASRFELRPHARAFRETADVDESSNTSGPQLAREAPTLLVLVRRLKRTGPVRIVPLHGVRALASPEYLLRRRRSQTLRRSVPPRARGDVAEVRPLGHRRLNHRPSSPASMFVVPSRDLRVPRRSQRTRRRFISLAHPRRVRLEPAVELEVTSMQQRRGARRRRARAPLRRTTRRRRRA